MKSGRSMNFRPGFEIMKVLVLTTKKRRLLHSVVWNRVFNGETSNDCCHRIRFLSRYGRIHNWCTVIVARGMEQIESNCSNIPPGYVNWTMLVPRGKTLASVPYRTSTYLSAKAWWCAKIHQREDKPTSKRKVVRTANRKEVIKFYSEGEISSSGDKTAFFSKGRRNCTSKERCRSYFGKNQLKLITVDVKLEEMMVKYVPSVSPTRQDEAPSNIELLIGTMIWIRMPGAFTGWW